MPWFKVDDMFWGHPKQTALSKGAVALWVRAGSWSANHLTDGFVPKHMVPMLGCSSADAKGLTDSGLWLTADGGYQFHDWTEYQPTKEQVEQKRDEEAKRKAEWRAKRAAQRAASKDSPADVPDVSQRDTHVSPEGVPDVSQPGPVLPVPEPVPDPSSPYGEDEQTLLSGKPDETPPGFNEFWAAYPRKTQKRDAIKAYRSALKRADADTILAGLKRYRFKPERDYQPQAERWLNGDRWDDGQAEAVAAASETLTRQEIDNLIGPEYRSLPQPPADVVDTRAWHREQTERRNAERLRLALAKKAGLQ
jgi:hypothetical protein